MNLMASDTYISDLKTALKQTVNIKEIYNSSIMIVGATGLIGSFLVDMLMLANTMWDANIKIYALGRSMERLKQRFYTLQESLQLVLVEHDVTADTIFDFHVDYIIHAASNAFPAAFNTDPVGTILSNIIGARNLLEYTRDREARRFLYISSGEVYGQGDTNLDCYTESYSGYVDPMVPRSCYPISKRASENLCVAYSKQYNVDTAIVRPCHTYGPNATAADNRANVQFVNNVLADQDIIMKSAGTQMRSYCYIADCASAILTVMICGKCAEAYNIAYKKSRLTIADFARLVAKTAGKDVIFEEPDEINIGEQTPITKQVLSSEKLEKLGWEGSYTPDIGVSHLLKALKGE